MWVNNILIVGRVPCRDARLRCGRGAHRSDTKKGVAVAAEGRPSEGLGEDIRSIVIGRSRRPGVRQTGPG
eukprot:scaffold230_cov150-Isochrysis_galbana.AAC.2